MMKAMAERLCQPFDEETQGGKAEHGTRNVDSVISISGVVLMVCHMV